MKMNENCKHLDFFIHQIGVEGFEKRPFPFRIKIANAKQLMLGGIEYFTNHHAEWLEGYERIAHWLSDNNGKSLVMSGPFGVGKTILCMYVIPTIINSIYHKFFNKFRAIELCNELNYEKAISSRFIAVDDMGMESEFVYYGNRHDVFSEIVDGIEHQGTLMIASTNLTPEEIRKRYGERTFDRLYGNAAIANIISVSLRGKYESSE